MLRLIVGYKAKHVPKVRWPSMPMQHTEPQGGQGMAGALACDQRRQLQTVVTSAEADAVVITRTSCNSRSGALPLAKGPIKLEVPQRRQAATLQPSLCGRHGTSSSNVASPTVPLTRMLSPSAAGKISY